MKNLLTAITITAGLLTVTTTAVAEHETVSPKITWRSLVLLKQKLGAESNSQAKAKIGKEIIDVGAPLLGGAMAPSAAKSVAEARKSGKQLPEDQKDYVDYWLLRAVAAVEAENEQAGVQAAKVLKELGMMESDKPVEMDVVALLNTKGWIDAPEPAEKQKLVDALKKGDLKTAAAEADALLKNYPQNAKLIAARKAIQTELSNTTTGAATSPGAAGVTLSPASLAQKNFKNSLGCTMVWVGSLGVWVAETEVTQREFSGLMDQNPSEHVGPDLPVESVTAFEAKQFCDRLTKKDVAGGMLPSGYAYMLPTDEQWSVFCGNATLEDAITSRDRARTGPEPVKSLGPNEYGIYDTRGNVWEWTRTPYDSSLNSPEIRAEYPFGVVQSGSRKGAMKGLDPNGLVLRGGSWRSKGDLLKKTTRGSNDPGLRDNTNGFRVVLAPAE